MPETLNADGSTEQLAEALRTAADRLENIADSNANLKARFDNNDWSGLDQINTASDAIDEAREQLAKVADDIGIGGQVVREARQRSQMAGSYESIAGAR